MAVAERQLVIAVEGTTALGPYWPTILADYIEKIVRSFCASELPGKKLAGAPPELALVVFHTHGPHSAFCVQRSRWTKDMDAFLSWLPGISFSSGEFNEAPTCEGLAEALMIFHGSHNTTQNNQNLEAHKHCILVAASNPYPLPTPVYCLRIQSTDQKRNIELSKELSIADAETVAKSFPQCSVSLSVISPNQLPTLRAIYNAGKRNPQAADPPVDHAKNPQFLVLLSDNFMEAQNALCRPLHGNLAPNHTISKMESAFAGSIPGSISNANPSGGICAATVKVEPATIPAMISGSQLGQGGIGASGLGPTAINSVPAMMPTHGMAQHTGVNSLGVTNNFAINMPIGQHPHAQQSPPKYVKIWEGTLCGLRHGQPKFICKLEGYSRGAASETLYVGNADFLVFRSLNQHGFLGKLKEMKLCAVIHLPSQTLLLSMSDREDRLLGILFHGDVVVFRDGTALRAGGAAVPF